MADEGFGPGETSSIEDLDGNPLGTEIVNPPAIYIEEISEQVLRITWDEADEPSRDGYQLQILRNGNVVEDVFKRGRSHKFHIAAAFVGTTHKARVRTVDDGGNVGTSPTAWTSDTTSGIGGTPISSGSATAAPTAFSHTAKAAPPTFVVRCTDAAPNDTQDPTTYFYYVMNAASIQTFGSFPTNSNTFVGKTQSLSFTATQWAQYSGGQWSKQETEPGRTYYVKVIAKNAKNTTGLASSSNTDNGGYGVLVVVKRGTVTAGTSDPNADADYIFANRVLVKESSSGDYIEIRDTATSAAYVRWAGNSGNWSSLTAGSAAINLNQGGILNCGDGQLLIPKFATLPSLSTLPLGSFFFIASGTNLKGPGFYVTTTDKTGSYKMVAIA